MNIIAIHVDWRERYNHDPIFIITMDSEPLLYTALTFFSVGNYYIGEHEGYVRYFYKQGDQQEQGFGGTWYKLQMRDGTTKILKGPWSGAASELSLLWKPVLNVLLRTPKYNEKSSFLTGTFTKESLEPLLSILAPDIELYGGDYGWYPKKIGEVPKNPRQGRHYRLISESLSDEQARIIEVK